MTAREFKPTERSQFLHLQAFYLKVKQALEELEEHLGLKEKEEDQAISICLQVKGESDNEILKRELSREEREAIKPVGKRKEYESQREGE